MPEPILFNVRGRVSWFGGPDDHGVAPDEGLAFIHSVDDAPHLFLPSQPPGTSGLARHLDPSVFYVACRWDYDVTPKPSLLEHMALVRSRSTGMQARCWPADWGPHQDTGRVADISPGLMEVLGIATDDEVEVIYPYGRADEEHTMPYQQICISSGHGLHVRGASSDMMDEVDDARKLVERLAQEFRNRGVDIQIFHDDTSRDQSTNLSTIVNWHNAQARDLDISVHFNAYEQVSKPMGTEVLYVTQSALAAQLSAAIAACGFINRGGKKRTDLYFLNNTDMPAVLLEVCFVDSEADVTLYRDQFGAVADAIADALGGVETDMRPPPGERPERPERPRPPPVLPPAVIPRVDIEVSGEVYIYVNGEQVGTKG